MIEALSLSVRDRRRVTVDQRRLAFERFAVLAALVTIGPGCVAHARSGKGWFDGASTILLMVEGDRFIYARGSGAATTSTTTMARASSVQLHRGFGVGDSEWADLLNEIHGLRTVKDALLFIECRENEPRLRVLIDACREAGIQFAVFHPEGSGWFPARVVQEQGEKE